MRNRTTLILSTAKLHYWQLAGGILKLAILTRITRLFQVIYGGGFAQWNGLNVYTLATKNGKTIYSTICSGKKLIIK
ncbi:hypothetical protein LAP9435_0659 [Lactiplantibacillus plantarum]|nr:hypothetical protein LAP8962_00661 [Lactiplantibacillus plantarum]VFI61187.1 hypothetical protein LAP9434_00659 [Lactiplantibacillus plantarum]VFQ55738.1 hypothetical protein LAP9435_0659 [Lactiplantibacillus plantarum]